MEDLDKKMRKALTRALVSKWTTMGASKVAQCITENTALNLTPRDVQTWINEADEPPFNWERLHLLLTLFGLSVRVVVNDKKKL